MAEPLLANINELILAPPLFSSTFINMTVEDDENYVACNGELCQLV